MHRFLQASFFAFCFIELSFGFSLQKNNVIKPNLDKPILRQPARENSTIDLQNWGLVNTDQSNSSRTESDLQNWGLVNTGQSNSGQMDSVQTNTSPNTVQTSTNAPVVTQKPNSCQSYVVQRPDFRKPGRRISEAKSFEYIWEMKNREDKQMHEAQCSQHRINRSLTQKATFKGKRRIDHDERGNEGELEPVTILGGGPADPAEFPHMGALGWRAIDGAYHIFKCGCTLISSKFVVTAAHCSRASPNDDTIANVIPEIVKLGDESISLLAYIRISRIFTHPLYESPMKSFDIALVELAEPINYFSKYIQPACLWHDYDTSSLGSQAIVTGWGYTDLVRKTMAKELQAAVLNIIDQNQCDQLLGTSRFFDGLQSHQICAGKLAGGVDTCQGDSGGPLQVKIAVPSEKQGKIYYLIGVTSFGRGCGNPDSPGVYTRISSFVDWIESIVWAE